VKGNQNKKSKKEAKAKVCANENEGFQPKEPKYMERRKATQWNKQI
jgi:hypothetical protein